MLRILMLSVVYSNFNNLQHLALVVEGSFQQTTI
jgi:hypothetical protein